MLNHNKTTGQKSALGYLRISDKKQIAGESPANQKRVIQKYADDNGIRMVDWFYDEAKSGKNTDRDELQNMLRLATKKKSEIDFIIVYKMSRASRNLTSFMVSIEAVLEPRGISIRSATETFDESPMGKFVKNLHVMTAELENDTKREFVVDNMTTLTLQGYWLSRPPRGYDMAVIKNDIGKPRRTIKPNLEAKLIKDLLLRWNRGDIKESELARYATSIGLFATTGKPMTQDVIHKLIISPVYAGEISNRFTNYERVLGKHDPLISKQIYEQNQLILKMKNKDFLLGLKHNKTNEMYPLRRFMRCPDCNEYMTASQPNNSPRYYCYRASCPNSSSIMTRVIHERFEELLKYITPTAGTTRLLKELLKRQVKQELGSLNTEISRTRDSLDANDNLRRQILNKFITDRISEDDKKDAMRGADADKLILEMELSSLEKRQTISLSSIDYAINFMANISEHWSEASLELRQTYQELIFPKGFVYDIKKQKFITPEISPLYRLDLGASGAINDKNFSMVIPRRIELRLPG